MLATLNILTFAWTAFWAMLAFRQLAVGKRNSLLFVILIHFVFSGGPLLLDVVVGQPYYNLFPRLHSATRDDVTSIIYCLYVGIIPWIWWTWKGQEEPQLSNTNSPGAIDTLMRKHSRHLKVLFWLLLITPLLAWIFAPNPAAYLQYGIVTDPDGLSQSERTYHIIVSQASWLCVVGAAGLLTLRSRINLWYCIILLPWLTIAIWVNSKRHIFALVLFFLGYVFWRKGYFKGVRLYVAAIAAIIVLGLFSWTYQSEVRNINSQTSDFTRLYDNLRIDYGRDHVIKLAIFAELYPTQVQILEYRGQSTLFYLVVYVPRVWWPDKPIPYGQYVTTAALAILPRYLGWTITTSWLDEAIANFSWLGLLIGPLTILFICRSGDASENIFTQLLTVAVACLFLTVHLNAFVPLFYLWILLVLSARLKLRRREHPQRRTVRLSNGELTYDQGATSNKQYG